LLVLVLEQELVLELVLEQELGLGLAVAPVWRRRQETKHSPLKLLAKS